MQRRVDNARTGVAATHVNVPEGLIEQADFKITVSEQGVWRISQNYECKASSLVQSIPDPYAAHPVYTFALLAEVTGVRVEGDMALITCDYTGLRSEQSPHVLELIAGTSEDPIETHDRYKNLTQEEFTKVKAYCDAPSDENFAVKPVPEGLTTAAEELIRKKLEGKESFLNNGITLRDTWFARTFNLNLGQVGKITNPPAGAPNGTANWLLVNFSSKRVGGYHEMCAEYRASGPKGWDAEIYA